MICFILVLALSEFLTWLLLKPLQDFIFYLRTLYYIIVVGMDESELELDETT